MKIGDSLRRKIDKGLANSRFGIVVISRTSSKKGWTNYELDGIITKSSIRRANHSSNLAQYHQKGSHRFQSFISG